VKNGILFVCAVLSAVCLIAFGSAEAHTLYIKPDSPVHQPNQIGVLKLVNGTFWKNEATIEHHRISRVTIVNPNGEAIEPDESHLVQEGDISKLELTYSQPGIYVVGVALKPRQIRVAAEDFNYYLKYEGLLDDANERRNLKEGEVAAAERYTKFAKSIVWVDKAGTGDFSRVLGHRVEVIPLVNPGELRAGSIFRAQILKDGLPLTGELVYANTERMSETTEDGIFKELIAVRSDSDGVIEFQISEAGSWYVRFIHLSRLGDSAYWYSDLLVWLGLDDPAIPYESLWATLTFEVNQSPKNSETP